MCTGAQGWIHNFFFYSGKILACPGQPDIGASGNVVLRLLKDIPRDHWHKVFFDNWFNSEVLQTTLWSQGFASIGTVRTNRLRNCQPSSDKELKKKGRGSTTTLEKKVGDATLTVVKWLDSRSVTLLSTGAATLPKQTVVRWDKKERKAIEVQCPSIVMLYNASMGGVDLLDSLIALYRTTIRSKKWYHRIIFHLFDMVVVQSWLTYRVRSQLPQKDTMPLLQFKERIATCLTMQGKSMKPKLGRPSLGVETQLKKKKSRGPCTPVPELAIRTDEIGHFPILAEKRGRCKFPNCKGFTSLTCEKCKVFLCLTVKSNCFRAFHKP